MRNFLIACLLHDIGKVVIRAKNSCYEKKHADEGAKWLSNFKQGSLGDEIFSLIKMHHDSQNIEKNPLLALLQKANYLAAEGINEEKCYKDCEQDCYISLATPFSRISIKNDGPKEPYSAFWPLEEVRPTLPRVLSKCEKTTPHKYKQILSNFEQSFSQLLKQGVFSPNTLLLILEKYFSFIPATNCVPKSGCKDWPDISLFDHLKLTGAIGSAYYLWCKENFGPDFYHDSSVAKKILSYDPKRRPFILAGGDVSGVQNFIYTISSKGALRSLKGRSFFLELLIEDLIDQIINQANVYRCNVIFSGGGHFYLLLPNIKSSEKVLRETRERINDWLWGMFGENLELHLEWEAFGEEIFLVKERGTRAGEIFAKVSEKIEKSKKKPFYRKLSKMFSPLPIHPSCLEKEGAPGACEVCFRDDAEVRNYSGDLELMLCQACWEEFLLGKNIQAQSGKNLFSSYLNVFPEGQGLIKIENRGYRFSSKPISKKYFAVNHFSPGAEAFLPCGYYQGIWEFDRLKKEGFGLPRLAALRMDVDNLGRIFKEGLSPRDQTFSRVSAISRSLNLFFKYYLNALLCGTNHLPDYSPPQRFNWAKRNIDTDGRKVAIIYAGGDDLFIMGDWLDVCECAVDIIESFSHYTGNPELTISGGVVFGYPKIPVYQLARLAGQAEDKAKNLRNEKNAFFIFGEVLPNEIFSELKDMLIFWQKYLDFFHKKFSLKEPFSKNFLYRVLNITQEISQSKKEKAIYLPILAYLLARLDKEKLGKDYLSLQNWLLSLDFENNWKLLHIVTQWIIMSMRGEDDEKEQKDL